MSGDDKLRRALELAEPILTDALQDAENNPDADPSAIEAIAVVRLEVRKALAATQEQREEPGLTEDDAKFLDQVATAWSRNDGDPPDSEGIWALKLRAVAATIRKGALSSSKSDAPAGNQ